MSKKKEFIFVILLIVLMILISEAALRLLGIAVPEVGHIGQAVELPISVPDPALGIRPNPLYPGHDARGFRNGSVPHEAEIVAMGDSQTYGMDVRKKNEPWPQRLALLSGKRVYNMAFGSYGPVHRLILLPEALELKPKLVIEAFYTGNDLFDAFQLVYGKKSNPQSKSLINKDETVLRAIRRAEGQMPLLEKVMSLTRKVHGLAAGEPGDTTTLEKRSYLSRHSRMYRLMELAVQNFRSKPPPIGRKDMQTSSAANGESDLFLPFSDGQLLTVFNPSYRLLAVDRSDPRIQEGFRLSMEAMRIMAQKTRENDVRFAVLLIPTKELVFKQAVMAAMGDRTDAVYSRLISVEEKLLADVKEFLAGQGIPVIDSLEALRAALENGPQPYRASQDGHPAPSGHRAVAYVVAQEISRLRLLQ